LTKGRPGSILHFHDDLLPDDVLLLRV